MRQKTFALTGAVAELALPAGVANIHAPQVFSLFIVKQRVIRLPVGKGLGTRFTGVRAGLDVPLVHGL